MGGKSVNVQGPEACGAPEDADIGPLIITIDPLLQSTIISINKKDITTIQRPVLYNPFPLPDNLATHYGKNKTATQVLLLKLDNRV